MNNETLIHRKSKRTTVTLEADVAESILDLLARNKNLKEKDLINRLLRKGINAESIHPQTTFKIEGFTTQMKADLSAEELEQMLDEI